jgi:hypothetical protein
MRNFFTVPNSELFHPATVQNFRRNFFANIMDAGFWFFGDSFMAAYTIFPVFMSTITDSPILIGLIQTLEGAGWFLPQLFLALAFERKEQALTTGAEVGVI